MLGVHGDDVGQLPKGCHGPLAFEQAQQAGKGACARLAHVEVRVGAIDADRVRMADHVLRDVRMQVEADRNRHLGTKLCSDAAKQLAFAVIVACGDHRAVEVKIQAVQRPGLAEAVEDARRDCLERMVGNRTGRLCGAPKDGMEIDRGVRFGDLDESRDWQVQAERFVTHGIAFDESGP